MMNTSHYIERLRVVPSLFNLNIVKIRKNVLKDIIDKADMDDSDVLQVPQENLVSFTHFVLQQIPESQAKNDQVLLSHPNNINAICLRIILSANARNFTEAEEHLQTLIQLKDERHLVVEAEAETAYAYSKMGPEYIMVAISKFTKVVEERPDQYEWKYRLALVLRRCQNPSIRILLPTKLEPTENFVKCRELFDNIVTNCSNNTLKALSLVEIPLLYIEPNCRGVDFQKLRINPRSTRKIIIDYLDRAMDFDPENVRVLQETGRILRKIKEFEAAKKILETVVGIQEKDVAYHHLALTIQKLEGTTPRVIDYYEKASRIGLNSISTIDLGKAYIQFKPPNYQKALECFNGITSPEYPIQRQKYENLSNCYKSMMYETRDKSKKNGLYQKALEMNRKSIVFGLLSVIKSTPHEDFAKFEFIELFPGRLQKRFYDYNNQRECFLRQLHAFQGKSNYAYLERLERIVRNGSLTMITDEIKADVEAKKYEDCLESILFLLITDIQGIDQVVISTMMKILQAAVESRNKALASKCLLWPIEYFYKVDDSIGHFRILADSKGGREADMIESWLLELSMIVVRNDEDISSFLDRREALLESLKGNVAVICIFKGNNCTFLEEYPINMLSPNKPYLIPVPVYDCTVPQMLRDHEALPFPQSIDEREKALWLKSLGEIIFDC